MLSKELNQLQEDAKFGRAVKNLIEKMKKKRSVSKKVKSKAKRKVHTPPVPADHPAKKGSHAKKKTEVPNTLLPEDVDPDEP